MITTIEALGQQHQEVLAQLSRMESQLEAGDPAGDAARFAGYLNEEVMHHFLVEEQALFPVLGRHLGFDHGPLAVMNHEHAVFRALLQGLTAGVRARDLTAQHRCAGELIQLLRGHIEKEDHVLFPMASRLLSPEEQREVEAHAAALDAASPHR